MKFLLIFPPQWIPFNSHLAPAAIQSILINNGYDVKFRDLNIEFYNTVLSPEFILGSIDKAFKNYNANAGQVFHTRSQKKELKEFPSDFQKVYLRYKAIEKVAKESEYQEIASTIKQSLDTIKDKKHFYNPPLLNKAFATITKATNILSSVYYPSKVNFLNVTAQTYYNVNELALNCSDKDGNIFYNFYQTIFSDFINQKFDCIGISLGDYTQLIPALTLTMFLKSNTQAHICIGGNLFGRYMDVLINNPDFFRIFTDSIVYYEGEKPVLELLRHLKGEIGIEEVPNIIYLSKDGQVKINEASQPLNVSELYTPDFSDFPFELYYTPETIFNMQASRSCYWRKCSFCTHHFGSNYAIKSIEQTINELKKLQQKYNAKYFHFVDEAMSPSYLGKLSDRIIKEEMNINFYIYARMEKEFTPDLLKQARQAGLRFILWGFESANERIYGLMNKGELCGREDRLSILKSAFEADIWNHLFIMFGFPSESFEEAKDTVHFLRDNREIISHSLGSTFVLLEDAPILKNLEKYAITKVQRIRLGFSFAHKYETNKGMKPQELKELENYKKEMWQLDKYRYRDSSYREKVFLYVCRYGVKNISKMKKKMWL